MKADKAARVAAEKTVELAASELGRVTRLIEAAANDGKRWVSTGHIRPEVLDLIQPQLEEGGYTVVRDPSRSRFQSLTVAIVSW